ncbi:MAG: hypothetical protein JWQ38_991 [Flavipsychrobacter sp.]|nr:hypothetical protein [Flavipsychrobacter sp.]
MPTKKDILNIAIKPHINFSANLYQILALSQ